MLTSTTFLHKILRLLFTKYGVCMRCFFVFIRKISTSGKVFLKSEYFINKAALVSVLPPAAACFALHGS